MHPTTVLLVRLRFCYSTRSLVEPGTSALSPARLSWVSMTRATGDASFSNLIGILPLWLGLIRDPAFLLR